MSGVSLNQTLIEYVQNLEDKTHAEIPLPTLMKLLEEKPVVDGGRLLPPVPRVISSATYSCEVSPNSDVLQVKVALDIYTFQVTSEWTVIPLFSRSVPLSDVNVHRVATKGCEDEVAELEEDAGAARDAQGWLGSSPTHPSHTSLFTIEGGRYSVTATMSVALKGKRAAAFTIPRAAEGKVEFTAPVRGSQIRIPSTVTMTMETTEKGLPKKVAAIDSKAENVSLEWTEGIVVTPEVVSEDEGELSDVEVAPEPVVSSFQQCMATLGDGLLSLHSTIIYTLVNARRDKVVLELPNEQRLRVLSVEGPNISGFKVLDPSREGAPPSSTADDGVLTLDTEEGAVVPPPPYDSDSEARTLEVSLRYPAEKTVKFVVIAELEYSTRDTVKIPFIKCADTSREKKHLAVGVRTSVEVDEVSSSGLSPLDRTEVSQVLSKNNILMAYLALSRSPELTLKMTKHQDVGVMIAVVDKALWTVSQTPHGKRISKLNMSVRNTTLQYMAVAMEQDARIWSLVVDGEPTKPARNAKGDIMLPLRKSGRGANQFDVELVFVTDVGAMTSKKKKKKGVLELTLPALSLEVSNYQCLLSVPKSGFKYGEVTGDMRPTNSGLSISFADSGVGPVSVPTGNNNSNNIRRSRRRDSFSEIDSAPLSYSSSHAKKSKGRSGAVPVRVTMPTSSDSTSFVFKKTLIDNKALSVSIPFVYSAPKPLKHK